MIPFVILSLLTAAGCAGFAAVLGIDLPEHATLTAFLRVVLGLGVTLALNAGIAILGKKTGFALKRPLITANVFLATLLLLFLQNKVMVGTQEIQADIQQTEGNAYSVTFRDLAGVPVLAGHEEILKLEKRLKGDEFTKTYELVGEPAITPDQRIKLELKPGQDDAAFRDRVLGKPFIRRNAERGLFEVGRGIDLQGGVEFICQLYDDLGQRVSADDEVLHILRSRLDQRGLTEPLVARLSNGDVQIVIPGGTPADAARTRKVIEQTGRLEFREVIAVYMSQVPGELPAEVVRRPNGGYDLSPEVRGSRKQIVAVDKSRDPNFQPSRFYHLGPVELTGKDVKTADRTLEGGRDAVAITFTATGGAKNYEFTSRLFGDRQNLAESQQEDNARTPGKKLGVLAILFDGKVESAPRVQSPSNTNCLINGQFSPEEIDSLKAALRGGSLAVTPVVLSERVVGATLGMDAVNRSVTTMLWCFIGILTFMALYYRRLGIVAVLCMLITGGLIWATLSIFGAVMTLPGLAGLVLSVAMSMDTNVLVYERIREEQRAGKDLNTAIELGYGRAFLAILDSNLTTIFSGMILYWIGSGPVKGFGLTLAVGVAVSMFSGVYIGRLLTDLLCKGKDKVSMAGLIPEPRLPYVRWRRVSYGLSFITAILGLGYFAFGHLLHERGSFDRNFDIDFTGGNLVQTIFTEPLSHDEVSTKLAEAWQKDANHFDLLDPGEMAPPQPYFSTLAGGDASRQWVFRGRDEAGAALEALRADLDQERGGLQKEIDRARDPDNAKEDKAKNEAYARELEPKVRDLSGKIRELEDKIAARVQVFKQQIADAYPGKVASEGSEILGVTWNNLTMSVDLATLESPELAQLTHLKDLLLKREELADVNVSALVTNTGVHVEGTYREKPSAVPVANDGDMAALVQAKLGDIATPALTHSALELYQASVQASATAGLTVAQPFPASQHFSGQVAGAMKQGAIIALTLATLAMLAYIAARFEFGFGVSAIVAMAHDVLLTLGLIALFGLRIDLTVVAALLTIIGYSVNDTIVTFDRIRENLKLMAGKSLGEIIDISIAQTMPRTILTGGATILAIIVMMMFAGEAIYAFNATLLIGTLLGTYSSIFVAAPLLLMFDKKSLVSPEPVVDAEVAVIDGPEGA